MALFTKIPKIPVVAPATPTDENRWLSNEANQVIDEIQNLEDDTGQTKSSSDLFQVSKAVARYVFGNTLVENSGTSTHNGSTDIYVVERDGGDSKKIPAVLLRGIFSVKILNTNQSNSVNVQLGTNTPEVCKKFDMAGNLTEIPVGEFRVNDIVLFAYDSTIPAYILKKVLSNDEVQAIVGKFNILNFLDFTASAPVAGGTIGDRYINTTGGTISAGKIDTAGVTVVANKIYELYDDGSPYHWREIDEQDGDLVFNANDNVIYLYNGTSWTNDIIPNATTTSKGIVELATNAETVTGTDTTRALTVAALKSLFEGTAKASTGYMRLPVGIGAGFGEMIIEWGRYTGGGHAPTITFPLAFTTLYSINCTCEGDTGTTAYETPTATNFVGFQRDTSGVAIVNDFDWIAIGTV